MPVFTARSSFYFLNFNHMKHPNLPLLSKGRNGINDQKLLENTITDLTENKNFVQEMFQNHYTNRKLINDQK